MVAYAMHLPRDPLFKSVRIHPDDEHGKQFEFSGWLARRGFSKASSSGKTTYAGDCTDVEDRMITINPKSGLGDVVAGIGDRVILAECKGAIINTLHPGQRSRLDKGLHETVGRLMGKPHSGRQVAVVPCTDLT